MVNGELKIKTMRLLQVIVLSLPLVLLAEDYEVPKTWFGDPDLQGTWTNASLTTLERPDEYKTLIVSDRDALIAKRMTKEFVDAQDNYLEPGETPKAGADVGGYNTAWMDFGTELFKIDGKYRSSIITYPEDVYYSNYDKFYEDLKSDSDLGKLLKITKHNYIFTNAGKEHMELCLKKMRIKSHFW